MERTATRAHERHRVLRLTMVIGAIVIAALVSMNLAGRVATPMGWATFALSLLVAVSAGIEEFFHVGERWRDYRQSAGRMKDWG